MSKNIVEIIEDINNRDFKELNGREIISVSNLIEFLCEPFNKEEQAARCADKAAADPRNKYHGMTKDDILALWDQKADESKMYGCKLDEYAEAVFNNNQNAIELWKLDNNFDYDERLQSYCKGFDEFIEYTRSKGYDFVAREIPLYVQTPGKQRINIVTGRMDALFYNPEKDRYMVVDWKTTDDIKTQSFKSKRMKGPGMAWEDCDMGKYTVQLHTYKNALINTYHVAREDNVNVCVINVKKLVDLHSGKFFIPYTELFPFDAKRLGDAVDFAITKRTLLKNMKNASI